MSATATDERIGSKDQQGSEFAAESTPVRLNWGCGGHVAPGWINSDVKEEPGVDLVADIRGGLPLDADSIDYVASIHALPELSYPELVPALSELRRVLKPSGVLRLVLPDVDRAIDAYRNGDLDYFMVPPDEARSASGRFILHALWFGYSRSLFTYEFVEELLLRAGFERVQACAHGRTSGPYGRIVELDNRPRESIYVEARKPRPVPPAGSAPTIPPDVGTELEIVEVVPDPGAVLAGHFRARTLGAGRVHIVGWALGRDRPAVEVEVLADGSLAGRAPVSLERPDVAEQHRDLPWAASSGFQLELKAAGCGSSQLELFATTSDHGRAPLGRITVDAHAVAPEPDTSGAAHAPGKARAARRPSNTQEQSSVSNTRGQRAANKARTERAAGKSPTERAASKSPTERAASKARTERGAGKARAERAASNGVSAAAEMRPARRTSPRPRTG